MRIREVEVGFFKRVGATLPWSSAVVLFGPNDSGKTNLLEALMSTLAPQVKLRLEPLARLGQHPPAAFVVLLIELDGLDIDGHRDQEVLLAWVLDDAVTPVFPCPYEEDDAERLAVEEEARWAGLRAEYSSLGCSGDRAQGVSELVHSVRLAAYETCLRRLQTLDEASRPEFEVAAEDFDSCWFVFEEGVNLRWLPVNLQWLPRDGDTVESLAEFVLHDRPSGITSLNEPLGIRVVRLPASEESLAGLYGRLETLLERLSVQDRRRALQMTRESGYGLRPPLESSPWVERVGDVVSLRPVVIAQCQALSESMNELAPQFVSDAYEIVLEPLHPDEWRAYGDRRIAIRLRPHGLDRDFDLGVASSGITAWVVTTASEALRLMEDELAETAHQSESTLLRPGLTVYVFDEPEAHLHPLAQEQAALWIANRARAGAYVLLATHAVPFLQLPLEDVEYLRVTRSPDWETVIEPITGDILGAVGESAEALGLPPAALIQLTRAWLVVEGEHDRQILTAFYGRELRGAGIQILALRGAGRAKASFLNLDALGHLQIPFYCLLDNTRATAVLAGRIEGANMSEEERIAEQLIRLSEDNGTRLEVYGLPFPDIICALPIEAVREVARENGGNAEAADSWDDLIHQHERHRHDARERGQRALALKPFVLDALGLNGLSADYLVAETLRVMGGQAPVASPLSRLVTEVIAAVSCQPAATNELK